MFHLKDKESFLNSIILLQKINIIPESQLSSQRLDPQVTIFLTHSIQSRTQQAVLADLGLPCLPSPPVSTGEIMSFYLFILQFIC